MNKNLFIQAIKDFKRCAQYKGTSDTWIKTNEIIKNGFDYDNIKTLESNTNFSSITQIENHPSLIFDSTSEKKIFDSLIKTEENNLFLPHKNMRLNKKKFSTHYIANLKIASKIINFLKNKKKNITILEIGGGIGLLSSILLSKINCKIILCDLPQTLTTQRIFLSNLYRLKKHNFIANSDDLYKENFDINYINCSQILKQKFTFDLAININSFQEMKLETVNKYIKFISINLKNNGFFVHQNCIGHSTGSSLYPSKYSLPNNLKIENLEYNFPSSRGDWVPFFTVVCKKKIQNKIRKSLVNKRTKILKQYYRMNSLHPFLLKKNEVKKLIINKLNSENSNENISKHDLYNKSYKSNFPELKINTIFQKIHDSLICDFQNFDHSFKFTKKNTENIFKYKKIFDDPYWAIRTSSIFYGINDYKNMDRSLKLIKNESFDIIFRKLILNSRVEELVEAHNLYDLLTKCGNDDFISETKILHCSAILNKNLSYQKNLKSLLKKISNKDQAIIISKIILNKNFGEYFYIKNKYFHKYLSNQDLNEILISLKNDILIKNKNYILANNLNNKKDLNNLLLKYKLDLISENNLIKHLKKRINKDYYLIGKILLKTLNNLSKKNICYLVNQSSRLRKNNFMNDEFLGNILLHSELFTEAKAKFSKIKTVDKNIISLNLKYQICDTIIKNSSFKRYLENQKLSFITFDDQCIFFPLIRQENVSRLL